MPLATVIDVFLVGTLGGTLLEVVHWWNFRRRNVRQLPKYAKSVRYWVITVLMALSGGVLTIIYRMYVFNVRKMKHSWCEILFVVPPDTNSGDKVPS